MSMFLPSARLVRRSDAHRQVLRLIRVRPMSVQIRHYSAGGRPPGFSLTELITNTASILLNCLRSTAVVQQITDQTPAPTMPTQSPLPKSSGLPADPWAGETSWVAIDKDGGKCYPGTIDMLYRSHDVSPDVLFADGMPAPGHDYDLKRHQQRTSGRAGSDDAFYGACDRAAWRASDGGDWDGPVFDTTNRYMSVIKGAWGLGVGNQLGIDIVEMEAVVHMVPPHKIVAVLDKVTGEIYINESTPQAVREAVTVQLRKLWAIGIRLGIFTELAKT